MVDIVWVQTKFCLCAILLLHDISLGAISTRIDNGKLRTKAIRRILVNEPSSEEALITRNDDLIDLDSRIVGGSEVPVNRYPYMVSVTSGSSYSNQKHICGGALIAPDMVLCAAHCAEKATYVQIGKHYTDSVENYKVQASLRNKKNKNERPQAIDVETFFIIDKFVHPDYSATKMQPDFSLFLLSSSSKATPVQLHRSSILESTSAAKTSQPPTDRSALSPGQILTVIGYGAQYYGAKSYAEALQRTSVFYLPNADCNAIYEDLFNPSDMICAAARGKDACQGDSGGPLVWSSSDGDSPSDEDILVGVVSWGKECADEDWPGVYARVSSNYDWIYQVVCEESEFGCIVSSVNQSLDEVVLEEPNKTIKGKGNGSGNSEASIVQQVDLTTVLGSANEDIPNEIVSSTAHPEPESVGDILSDLYSSITETLESSNSESTSSTPSISKTLNCKDSETSFLGKGVKGKQRTCSWVSDRSSGGRRRSARCQHYQDKCPGTCNDLCQ